MHAEESRELEKKSSAVSLSDMEMFIFPELIYSLVLANIMSPRIWKWREDPWFDGIDDMKENKKLNRIKQFIMDKYVFNLDLETWGLTTKDREMARFSPFIDEDTLAGSNALFGYEGDKYYFDIDIRSHFGLDKYTTGVIPYWKTETIEAMDAFVHKPGYDSGAGECVSLATMYAAALFVVGKIPLSKIYLMATPLHSQNFIDIKDGILTNNRRLVTKNMWFNGTALSAKARRALENERVTIVAHESGIIHAVYDEATIEKKAYENFKKKITSYLKAPLNSEALGNFLRHRTDLQRCFQIRHAMHGVEHYVGIETVFPYEQNCPYRLTDNTRDKLLGEVDQEEFGHCRLPRRLLLNDLEEFIKEEKINLCDEEDYKRLRMKFASDCLNAQTAIDALRSFMHTSPNLPEESKKEFKQFASPLGLTTEMSREEIIARVAELRDSNTFAHYAAYAYRDLSATEAEPFLKAAIERNPVCAQEAEKMSIEECVDKLNSMCDRSIYDGPGRLAQPDEVWNFSRGDGVEKAVTLATIIRSRGENSEISLNIDENSVILKTPEAEFSFTTAKALPAQNWSVPELPSREA